MSQGSPCTIAVDAVGGDFAPQDVLDGVQSALAADEALHVALVGPAETVEPFAAAHAGRVDPIPATQVIGMDEHPAHAVRSKKDSSIVVGCRLVREGQADGFFSAGSTGAAMAAATLVIGRIRGVERPAIATVLPTAGRPCVLLDVGANADCRPEHLVQFALMGRAYAQAALDVDEPSIGLLNIGEEPTKGSQLAIGAHALMAGRVEGFAGNVEGRDVLSGTCDVIVTDGFTGNVALKLLEGTSRTLLGQVKDAITSSVVNKAAAAVVAPSLTRLRKRLDPEQYGGAPLLGVQGVCIIAHGSSKAPAIANALKVASHAVRGDLTANIAACINEG